MALTLCIILLKRALCGRLTVRIVGLIYGIVILSMLCFASVEFIVLKVTRYVKRSVLRCVLRVRLTLRFVDLSISNCSLRTVTNLVVAVSYSIPLPCCHEAHALLTRGLTICVRVIKSLVDDVGI